MEYMEVLPASRAPRRRKTIALDMGKFPAGKILLASGSPRRKKLFAKIAAKFDIVSAPPLEHCAGRDAKEITGEKAEFKAVWALLKNPDKMAVGADTLLEVGGKIFGKPKSKKEAQKMMDAINGKSATAFTSVCIAHVNSKTGKLVKKSWTEKAKIYFKKIGKKEMGQYIKSGKWEGKAGGFDIGSKPACDWVEKIEGDENVVIGLPLKKLKKILAGN
jgi:septum formation protein